MEFWKPGTIAPGSNIDRDVEKETNDVIVSVYNTFEKNLTLAQQRTRLPIYKNRNQILYALEKFQVVIIVGQTGSGKTTQIPQYLDEAKWTADGRIVACTQPRRVAATTVAARVAEEMNAKLGQEVGYAVRFDEQQALNITRIKYMTDGMLFREILLDPLLTRYSVIMIDEAHERSLYTDMLVGVLKKILKKRKELRVIISSATLDAEIFFRFFNDNDTSNPDRDTAIIVSLEGRMYPVDVHYLMEPCSHYVNKTVETIFQIHEKEPQGDILAFLTGKDEIDTVVSMINEEASEHRYSRLPIIAVPLYGGLTMEQQLAAFQPAPKSTRKVVVATNIAEASVTIDGIVYVIDSGFVKISSFNPKTGMESLIIVPCSKASAQQRAGRAGRTRPGKAYRLYTESAFEKLQINSIPEIQRTNLAPVILQLKALGIDNVVRFEFLSPPPAAMMIRAVELLYSLGALDDSGRLTMPFGTQLAEFPIDPMMATMVLNSRKFKCTEEILTIAAMLTVQNVFYTGKSKTESQEEKRKFSVEEGDLLTYLNVYNAFILSNKSTRWCAAHHLNAQALTRAAQVRNQLKKYYKRYGVESGTGGGVDDIRKCIVSGYFCQAAKMSPDGSYKSVREGVTLHMHPNSVLFRRTPSWVVFTEVVETTKAFIRDVTVIEPQWLTELAPHFYEDKKIQRN